MTKRDKIKEIKRCIDLIKCLIESQENNTKGMMLFLDKILKIMEAEDDK